MSNAWSDFDGDPRGGKVGFAPAMAPSLFACRMN